MLSKVELQILEAFLDAPKGSEEEREALDEVISLVDARAGRGRFASNGLRNTDPVVDRIVEKMYKEEK